jgi:hypothetical protein
MPQDGRKGIARYGDTPEPFPACSASLGGGSSRYRLLPKFGDGRVDPGSRAL